MAWPRPGSSMSMLSVISSSSSRASTPHFSSRRGISTASCASRNERAERLTATDSSWPSSFHLRTCSQRGVEDVGGERRDQAGLLGDRHELGRADEAEARVLPARQGLDADHLARGELGLGLEEEHDLAVLDRLAQAAGQRQPARAEAVQARLEHRVAAAGLLGRVHGDVGALDQRLDAGAVRGMAGHADRGVDLEREALDLRTARAGRPAAGGRRRWRRRGGAAAAAARRTRRRRGGRRCRSRRATARGGARPPPADGRRRDGRACR